MKPRRARQAKGRRRSHDASGPHVRSDASHEMSDASRESVVGKASNKADHQATQPLEGTDRPANDATTTMCTAVVTEPQSAGHYSTSHGLGRRPDAGQSPIDDEAAGGLSKDRDRLRESRVDRDLQIALQKTCDDAVVGLPIDESLKPDSLNAVEVDRERPLVDSKAVDVWSDEAQDIRNGYYLEFEREDENDYTKGPVRMVFAADGVENCAVLLLTLPLSKKVQLALKIQRQHAVERKKTLRKKQKLLKLVTEIRTMMSKYESRLATLRRTSNNEAGEVESAIEVIKVLQLMIEDNLAKHNEVTVNLRQRSDIARQIYEEVLTEMEQAFITAKLIEPAEVMGTLPYEVVDLNKEYLEFTNRRREAEDSDLPPASPPPLDMDPNYLRVPAKPMTDEELQVERVKEIVWSSHHRLQSAQAAFDRRDVQRMEQYQENVAAAARGEDPRDATPEDFDVRWVQRVQELTRELIEAEAAYAEAISGAAEAGLEISMENQQAGFADGADDGYLVSTEQVPIASVPSPKIDSWLNDVDEVNSPSYKTERHEEVDDWTAEDIEVSDSVSLVAEGNDRKRIDEWQEICGLR